jgi:demethylmenaquinone methyltransferase/2-methoxy-6-polyprenyl-1,4-benzoquinol methylase
VSEIGSAYAAAAESWAGGPSRIYQHLADALVACAPGPLAGRRIADLGAGTGTVSRALGAAGAQVVAFDLVAEMLAQDRAHRPPGAVADVAALPIGDDAVDGAVAAFVLNHLPHPDQALAEMRRVTRSDGLVLAATFAEQPRHPAKVALDAVAARFGYRAPEWYEQMKTTVEPLTASAPRLAALAEQAGLAVASVTSRPVDVGADTAEAIAAYRLSMAQVAPFVAGLSPERRQALWAGAVASLGTDVEPMRPEVLFLVATVPGHHGPGHHG